jgi:hypothetical protein
LHEAFDGYGMLNCVQGLKSDAFLASNSHVFLILLRTSRLQEWINKDILGDALANGADSVADPNHNWDDTTLPSHLKDQVQV